MFDIKSRLRSLGVELGTKWLIGVYTKDGQRQPDRLERRAIRKMVRYAVVGVHISVPAAQRDAFFAYTNYSTEFHIEHCTKEHCCVRRSVA